MTKNEQTLKNIKTIEGEDLTIYYKDLKKYKPLKREEERDLLMRYKENNDLVARQKLITSNLRYAFSLVNKYRDMGVPMSDLIEEANCGLIDSIDEYDINKDVRIITYARWKMEYNMQRSIEKHKKILTSDLPEEYEEQFGDEYLNDNKDCIEYTNQAFINEDDDVSKTNAVNDVNAIIDVLNERETDFIKMYYGIKPYDKEFTYQEIADKYSISKERVRQIIDKRMRKLRVQALTILKQ